MTADCLTGGNRPRPPGARPPPAAPPSRIEDAVIGVHRLKGEPFFVNADLIEAVEARPDTVLTLVDGRKVVVSESPTDIVAAITEFRASIIVAAEQLRSGGSGKLVLLHGEGE